MPLDFVERVLTRKGMDALTAGTDFAEVNRVGQEIWTVPLTADAGAFDWKALSARLRERAARPQVVQLVSTDAAATRAAFQQAAATLRAGKRGALVEWPVTPAMLSQAANIWPGPNTVDIIGISIPRGTPWRQAADTLTAWREWAGDQGLRVAVHWAIGPDTTPQEVRNYHAWLVLAASQKGLAYDTVDLAGAGPAALAAYNSLWRQR